MKEVRQLVPVAPSSLGVVAVSQAMRRLIRTIERVARTMITVLVLGETGTGKEIVARLLHERSLRRGRFVAVNCAALPHALAESEFFGHTRGAFTGADRARCGLIVAAHGGTLLLDEVAELDPRVQAKLLRVLEERVVRSMGANEGVPVDVRIVAATCKDLVREVEGGRFREDLYYRLAGVSLVVPPLRDRSDDIPPLVEKFIDELRGDRPAPVVPQATLDQLCRETWPGNIRELRQAVARALVLGDEVLLPEHFALDAGFPSRPELGPVDEWLFGKGWHEIEREVIAWAIRRYGSIRGAAAALGRPRSTLSDRARVLGLSWSDICSAPTDHRRNGVLVAAEPADRFPSD